MTDAAKAKEDVRCFEAVLMLPTAVTLGPRERRPWTTASSVFATTANPSGANFGRLARRAASRVGGAIVVGGEGWLFRRGVNGQHCSQ